MKLENERFLLQITFVSSFVIEDPEVFSLVTCSVAVTEYLATLALNWIFSDMKREASALSIKGEHQQHCQS